MSRPDRKPLSSKQLLDKLGLSDDFPTGSLDLLDDGLDPSGDLVPLLRERYRLLKTVRHRFRPGMVVGWKPGLKNRRIPSYGKPVIVVEWLDSPLLDTENESGSTYFREPLDMVLGLFLEEGEHRGDFVVFHANSERYQPWPGEGD